MWGGLSRGGWVASAGIFPVVVGAAGQRGVGPRPGPLVGKRDAVDSIGARGGEAAILHCNTVNSCFLSKHFARLVGAGLALPSFHTTDKRQGQGKPSLYETRWLRLHRTAL